MKKGYNIESSEWCDLIFKNKNKSYGAYALRQSSTKRHIIALGVTIIAMAFVSLLPQLIGAVKEFSKGNTITSIEEVVVSQIEVNQKLPEDKIVREELAPPPPPLRSSIKVTAPVITKDEDVIEGNELKAVSEVLESTLTVSIVDIQGTDEKYGVTLDVLKEHRAIVETEKPKEEKFFIAEQMPQYLGGEAEMYAFISKNLKYPVTAQEQNIQGRVIVRFLVTSSGSISEVEVLRGIDPACDKEAMRVVKMMSEWIPGKQNGRNVSVYFTLPVVYRLQ